MDLQIDYNFNAKTNYTLSNGIPSTSASYEVRIINYKTLLRFTSNTTNFTAVRILKGDSNPNSQYYSITVPNNSTGSSRLVKVYGYSEGDGINDALLIFNVYQAG